MPERFWVLKQTPSVPLLVMLTCRPAFVTPWETQRPLTPLVLQRLTRPQTRRMIVQASGGKGFTDDVMSQLVEKVDGVPLYVEELTHATVSFQPVKLGTTATPDNNFALTRESVIVMETMLVDTMREKLELTVVRYPLALVTLKHVVAI